MLQMNGQTVLAAPILCARNLIALCANLVWLAYTASYPRNGCKDYGTIRQALKIWSIYIFTAEAAQRFAVE